MKPSVLNCYRIQHLPSFRNIHTPAEQAYGNVCSNWMRSHCTPCERAVVMHEYKLTDLPAGY